MTQIQLSLFGPFSLTVDGVPVSRFRSQREAALLAYLAVEADHAHARERLAGLLWPDRPETVARQNLRQTLTNLRALLHEDAQEPLLLAERNTVQWNRNSRYTLDVETFQRALATAATHNHADLATCADCQTRLIAAAELYRGPFLDNFAIVDSDLFDEWVMLTREQFQQQAIQMLSQLSAAALARGNWTQMAHFARHQVSLDPLHEPAHRHLLQALNNHGDRSGALSHFETFAAQLQRELAVEPSPETLALIEQIRAGSLAAPASPPRQPHSAVTVTAANNASPNVSPTPHPSISPSPIHDWGGTTPNTLFVGRVAEVTNVSGWLQSGVRLICLWGGGGIGKTALAQTVARSQTERIPVIIWRSLTNDPSLSALISDWLTVLGEQRIPATVPHQLDRLFEHLRRQPSLLVLDSLETLLQAGIAGRFLPEHAAYGPFFQRFVQEEHQSSLLLTTREQPELFVSLEEETPALRMLRLTGLAQEASQHLLAAIGVPNSGPEVDALIKRLNGNPIRLKFAAQSIQEIFNGDINTFLDQDVLHYGQGRSITEQYRVRLPYIEWAILFWLAAACEPLPFTRLLTALVPPSAADMAAEALRYSANGIVEALHSLQRRALLDQAADGFTLPSSILIQNSTSFLLDLLTEEVLAGKPGRILHEIGLIDPQATEELRIKQQERVLAPLVKRLAPHFDHPQLVAQLEQMCAAVNQSASTKRNYLRENLSTLLAYVRPGRPKPANASQPSERAPTIPAVLPAQLNPLIGRERELAEIVERLHQPTVRLLTLIGAGGMGKTTLALAVAQAILESTNSPQPVDGVFFVALAPLTSTAALPSAIATTLGLSVQGNDLGQMLIQQMRAKQILLILDNVEHLLQETTGTVRGIDFVAALLQAAPGVRILATSRERLNLRGEYLYHVQPLALSEHTSLAVAAEAPAVRLFIQSAQHSAGDFALTTENLSTVLRICRLVQGIPLGLELAAANVDLLPLAEIASEIERSAEFLSVDWHDMPARQRSMRAVFDWSWRLLTPAEQHTLRQLAIFRGGFTREAALQVIGAGLPALSGLTRKSLLQRVETAGRERFQIHELLRQFAAEQLHGEPQAEQTVRSQHAAYYLRWLATHEADMVGPRSPATLQTIELELGNIHEAWRAAAAQSDANLLGAAVVSLQQFYQFKGRPQEGVELFEQAATRLGEQSLEETSILTLWRIRTFQGSLLVELAEFERARANLEASLPVLRRLGIPTEIAFCLSTTGLLAYRTGNYHEAKELCQAAIDIYDALGDVRGVAHNVNVLGLVNGDMGEYAEARRLHSENLARRRSLHDRYGTVFSLNNLGSVAARSQEYAEAQRLYEEAMTLAQTIEYGSGISLGLLNLGSLAYWRGDVETALHLAQQAMAATQEINDRRNVTWALVNLGNAHLGLGNYAEAAQHLHEAARMAFALRAIPRTLTALTSVAALNAKTGNLTLAVELATFCLEHPASPKETQRAAATLLAELTQQLSTVERSMVETQAQTQTLAQFVARLN